MSVVAVTNVVVRRNPASLLETFELEVSFECLEQLEEDLEWRLVYVGDPEDKTKDQELDCIALGPIQRGALRFVFMADAPNYSLINKGDINGITIILLTGSYRGQEFVRVGWYVHNFFTAPEYVENPPDVDELSLDEMLPKMQRLILSDAPRVTRFHIEWDVPNPELPVTSPILPTLLAIEGEPHHDQTATPFQGVHPHGDLVNGHSDTFTGSAVMDHHHSYDHEGERSQPMDDTDVSESGNPLACDAMDISFSNAVEGEGLGFESSSSSTLLPSPPNSSLINESHHGTNTTHNLPTPPAVAATFPKQMSHHTSVKSASVVDYHYNHPFHHPFNPIPQPLLSHVGCSTGSVPASSSSLLLSSSTPPPHPPYLIGHDQTLHHPNEDTEMGGCST